MAFEKIRVCHLFPNPFLRQNFQQVPVRIAEIEGIHAFIPFLFVNDSNSQFLYFPLPVFVCCRLYFKSQVQVSGAEVGREFGIGLGGFGNEAQQDRSASPEEYMAVCYLTDNRKAQLAVVKGFGPIQVLNVQAGFLDLDDVHEPKGNQTSFYLFGKLK
jgi:hypothetical protein